MKIWWREDNDEKALIHLNVKSLKIFYCNVIKSASISNEFANLEQKEYLAHASTAVYKNT